MRIVVEASVYADPKWFPILDVILLLVEDQRHVLAAESADAILASPWVQQRSHDVRDLVRMSCTNRSYDDLCDRTSVTITEDCRRGGVVNFGAFNTRVHPLDAIVFLSTPFQVIVENEWFDGSFLLWMAKALGFERLIQAYRRGRFIFRHAGGKDSIPRSAAVFSKGVWPRRNGDYERAFRLWLCVLLDNDARYPGETPNATIIEQTMDLVAFVHQLRRRSIESYIPPERLRRIDGSPAFHRKVDALFRLTEEQRLHYHMKKGFKFDRTSVPYKMDYLTSTSVHEYEKRLFQTIAEADWNVLMEGFGRNLSGVYVEEQHRPNLNDPSLTDTHDRTELSNLIKAIYERI